MSHILVNVAWPYANGPRHIGHVAGFGVPSDVYARYERMKGNDVLMVSGTDEHGTPILVEAEKEGLTAQELANRYNRVIAKDLCDLGLSYDLFTRTTTGNHEQVVQELFKQCLANGYIYKGTQKVAISPSTGRTLPDRYIEGECPICHTDGARGDQCDACGNELDPDELINPVSKINGETPRFEETEHFFLDLPALAEANLAWLKTREGWRTNVINFSIGLFREVKPRAITRDIDWGIPVPVPGWIDNPNKKLYVWFDAVIGYLSASIEWARRKGDPEAWRAWWNDPSTPGYYFMGKDNITFHSQIWPSEMIAYNGKGSKGGETGKLGPLNLPEQVVASEFMTMEGKKFSSSRGIVIYVKDILARYPVDAVRYYISIAGPETSDADFTWAEFVRHNNEELAASWGNLVNRVANLIAKNFGDSGGPFAAAGDRRCIRCGRRHDRASPPEERPHRGDARGRRHQQVHLGNRAVEDQGRPGATGHRAACGRAGRVRREPPARPVPAPRLAEGVGGTRRHGRLLPAAPHRRGRGSRQARLHVSDHHRRLQAR